MEGSTPESRTIRDMCLYRGWLALFTSNCPRYGPLSWKVRPWRMEPSAKWSISVEGSRLRYEPSVICVFIAEGWIYLHRTVHDSGPKRGRFRGLGGAQKFFVKIAAN